MPPYYDIYGLSHKRDKETIETFLNYFSFREKIENRENQEIFVMSNIQYGIEELLIPVETISEVIDYGVANKDKGFVFYVGDNLKNVNHIILKFTYDEKIIFGISVEEKIMMNNNLKDNYKRATEIEKIIALLTKAYKTSIQFEYPPADDESEFDESIEVWRNMNDSKLLALP